MDVNEAPVRAMKADPSGHGLPVAVIGAGPIGLAAAAHLLARGERPLVFEAGDRVGSAVAAWGHVRMFSPWSELVDPVCRDMLREVGWTEPDPRSVPTGAELVERLLEPLAAHPRMAPHLRLGRRVAAVSRAGLDKLSSAGREDAPFALTVVGPGGRLERVLARAVLDASGTYATPNPAGADGVPLPGERAAGGRVRYGIPDVLGPERGRYAGRHTLVLGAGHSAHHAVLDLARLAAEVPGTRVTWALRRGSAGAGRSPGSENGGSAGVPVSAPGRAAAGPLRRGATDPLPARAALEGRVRGLLAEASRNGDSRVELVTGFRARRLAKVEGASNGSAHHRGALEVEGEDLTIRADELVVTTGYRPDLDMLRELRLELDPRLEAPVRLAPLIDPDVHHCGSVQPHGYDVLRHPEPDLYMVGMKSYGRAPSFLLLTGYEQVRSVVAALAGDMEEAGRVGVTLPAGACSAGSAAAGGCCAPAAVPGTYAIDGR